jgi:hypothetical protein
MCSDNKDWTIRPSLHQFDRDFILALLTGCGKDLESLTLAGDSVRALYQNLGLPKIRHLIVRSGRLPYQNFQVFIKKHTQTLEKIDLENLDMTLKRESGQPVIHGPYPTWFDVCGPMREMPRLKTVQLSNLRQDYGSQGEDLTPAYGN